MAELNLLVKILSRAAVHRQPKRRWNCPGDGMMAAYVDCALGDADRARLQEHLAGCGYCRALVADIVKLKRAADVPAVPAPLLQRVRSFAPPVPKRWTWNWATVAGAGALACVAIALSLLKTTETLTIPVWPAPAVPVISVSSSLPPANALGRETVRKLPSWEPSPTVTFPHPGEIIARDRLEFRWHQVADSLYYQVRVLTSEGELIWEGDSSTTRIKLPDSSALSGGKYFVSVSAVMKNGHMRKSNPVGFQVASSQ